jgi:shikimate kinase
MARLHNVFLIGPMGAGKSTIGRQLARDLNYQFYDSDQVIAERAGADIGWIFDLEGEAGFQIREEKVIAELTQLDNIVLATGGGVIVSSENRAHLGGRGVVVYLKTSIDQQYERTRNDTKRPQLQTPDLRATLDELWDERAVLYEELADVSFETDGLTVRAVATDILKYLLEQFRLS